MNSYIKKMLRYKGSYLFIATYFIAGIAAVKAQLPWQNKNKHAFNWHFGLGAELNFGNYTNGKPGIGNGNSKMRAVFTSASISDDNGNLLFYTNGDTIFNKNHQVMENGAHIGVSVGMYTSGNFDFASQPTLIVKKPQSNQLYYVFSIGTWRYDGFNYNSGDTLQPVKGLIYHVIDMNQNNGLGKVISGPVLVDNLVEEVLTFTWHNNQQDVWIVSHERGNNKFKSYLLSASGLSTVPVVSESGLALVNSYRWGKLRISPKGTHACLSNYYGYNYLTYFDQRLPTLELFNFNNATGVFSNSKLIEDVLIVGSQTDFLDFFSSVRYGAEFSPSGMYLYANNLNGRIFQYDISLGDGSYIKSTSEFLFDDLLGGKTFGDFQLGPDGKIHIANLPNSQQLQGAAAVITNPNKKGTKATLNLNGIEPDKRSDLLVYYGLPQFLYKDLPNSTIEITYGPDKRECSNMYFSALFNESIVCSKTYLWDFGDGTTSTFEDGYHQYAAPGTYHVTLTVNAGDCGTFYAYEEEVSVCPTELEQTYCITSFAPIPGERYVLSAWVKEASATSVSTYTSAGVKLNFTGQTSAGPFLATGAIIDGWQRIEEEFTVPGGATDIEVELTNLGSAGDVYFDDIRIYPVKGSLKSFVYDPVSMRLMAELDENNYATMYEYDEEGVLVRVKKETARGVMTIKETINSVKKK